MQRWAGRVSEIVNHDLGKVRITNVTPPFPLIPKPLPKYALILFSRHCLWVRRIDMQILRDVKMWADMTHLRHTSRVYLQPRQVWNGGHVLSILCPAYWRCKRPCELVMSECLVNTTSRTRTPAPGCFTRILGFCTGRRGSRLGFLLGARAGSGSHRPRGWISTLTRVEENVRF